MHSLSPLRRRVNPVIGMSAVVVAGLLAAGVLLNAGAASAATVALDAGSSVVATGTASASATAAPSAAASPTAGPSGSVAAVAGTSTSTSIGDAASSALFAGGPYLDPTSDAANAAAHLASVGDTVAAADARELAQYPTAIWLGDWQTDAELASTVDSALAGAARTGTTPVFVTYAIPDRDCGSYSAGGYSPTAYRAWSARIAGLLTGHRAVVLVEPDSLALLTDCPDAAAARLPLIADQVHRLAEAGIPAYLDGGNSHWNPASTMADRLRSADVAEARGFFTNVSNYYPTADERGYAEQLSALLGGAHYVIDTSRNGTGWTGTWCNASGSGLGAAPSVVSDGTHLDALLWVKPPGTSDGTCNGGPAAGAWYPAMAAELLANRVR